MKKMNLVVAAGFACTLSAVALADKPGLQYAEGMKVNPVRMAKVEKVNGQITKVGEWVEYNSFGSRAVTDACLYDGFGRVWGATADGVPVDGPVGSCTSFLPSGSRWFFGTAYVNPLTDDDMPVHLDGEVTQNDFGWYFLGTGAGTQLQCFVAVFATDGDANACVASTTGAGVIYDFGLLDCDSGFYYYSNVDLTGTGFLTLSSAETQVEMLLGEAFDGTTFTLTAGQFMLWGAPNNTGTGYVPQAGAFGAQEEGALDDDAPTDGLLDTVAECYTYLFGVCPDPLGKMVAFGGGGCGGACPADFNGDGFVSGDDFDQYVAAFELGDASADFNCDGFVSGDDFDAFVAAFELGCG